MLAGAPSAFLANPPVPGLGGSLRVSAILDRAAAGARISPADALVLFEEAPLLELGAAAAAVRRRMHPGRTATYNVDRNINYTNVCVYRCQFCAFYRPRHPEAYVLTFDQIGEKIQETIELGGTGILLQGGVHADLPFSFYEEMFPFHPRRTSARSTCTRSPLRRSSSSQEGDEAADARRHRAAARRGPAVHPGGGAEILEDSVRRASGR